MDPTKHNVIDELLLRLDNLRCDFKECEHKLIKTIKDIQIALYGEAESSDDDDDHPYPSQYRPSMKIQLRWTKLPESSLPDVHAESPMWRCNEHGVSFTYSGFCPNCFIEDQEDKGYPLPPSSS